VKKLICAILAFILCLAPAAMANRAVTDRAGNAITLPDTLERVISLAPSITQIVLDMGYGDRLVAVDAYSARYFPEVAHLPQYDMMSPDCEQIAMLLPDAIFVTGMSHAYGDNAYAPLMAMGVTMIVVPSSESLAAIREDVAFVGECFGDREAAEILTAGMDEAVKAVSAIAETIEDKKTVMFELAALPYLYSFGKGVFLDEMITMLGAENVFSAHDSWISVTEESAVIANPDVILTGVDYIEDPVSEILGRSGWENVPAVANKAVYPIDPVKVSLPNHHVTEALVEMALAVYPDAYASLNEQ